ncbi:30S ribosomal protein S20 [candidate division WOR-3 bacterium]|nr:30S ribosomal protein S20 [candidate division WOR-3 bacterium]MCK4528837.1 30S ribosomal protein S20 [candidate division WOR-3 bacterium]
MPITKSAKKRVRQNEDRTRRNKSVKTRLKNITKAISEETDPKKAEELLKKSYSLFDIAVSKGVIHRNNAARKKASLYRIVKEK